MSNQRGLTRLILAKTGTIGGAGDSFATDVVATAGASMAQYKMEGSSWANAPDPATTYANTYTFTNLEGTITTYNARANEIRNTATSAWTVSYISPLNTASATLNSISWSNGVGTLNLTINGELTTGTPSASVTVWYQGYTSPYLPYGGAGNTDPSICSPNCETAYNVDFTFSAGAVPASGSTTNTLSLSFVPDNYGAGFNPAIYGPGPGSGNTWSVTQDRRAGATPTIDAVEWATDASFTNVVSTSNPYTISSDNNTDVSYYLRYKLDGAGSWTTYASNPIVWQDPRNDT